MCWGNKRLQNLYRYLNCTFVLLHSDKKLQKMPLYKRRFNRLTCRLNSINALKCDEKCPQLLDIQGPPN